jgi:hypothetical protein
MQTSENINELAAALAKAQGHMGGALKDSANPFFKSKYADLESVWNACRKALSENGLAVIQTTAGIEGGVVVTTMLAHASGQWVRDTLPLYPKDTSPQGMGSAITYGRRYALAAIAGVYQTDDDAEAAQGRQEAPRNDSRVQEYTQRFMDAFEVGVDQAVIDLNEELKADTDLYRAVWGKLPSTMRRQIKEMVERTKAA